jgi:periplasmic copper chaperone A
MHTGFWELSRLLASVALVSLSAAPAWAGDIAISDAWIRALPVGSDAGYFTLKNTGSTTRVLTGASSPACGMLMLHQTATMNGMTHMANVASVNVPAGGEIKFAPTGYHLMCDRPRPAVKPGAKISVTLEFADGMKTTVAFAVKDATGH